jgi:hypothetical protein
MARIGKKNFRPHYSIPACRLPMAGRCDGPVPVIAGGLLPNQSMGGGFSESNCLFPFPFFALVRLPGWLGRP